ncbi:MAG: hypothetical protein JKX68_10625, partial [Flavobacteriales bacterium]|nr:hypothetical protein [Flavobacteriales bacterium]
AHIQVLKSKISAVNKPIYNNRLEKWKKNLSSKNIAQCDAICSKIGSHFNYEKYNYLIKTSFLLKWSISYYKGTLSVIKQQILFTLPYRIKLWRLKQVVSNTIYKNS